MPLLFLPSSGLLTLTALMACWTGVHVLMTCMTQC